MYNASNSYNDCLTVTIPQIEEEKLLIEDSSVDLEEVVITAKKPLVKFESGVLKINTKDKAIFSSGTVFEMLSKMPSVTYDSSIIILN